MYYKRYMYKPSNNNNNRRNDYRHNYDWNYYHDYDWNYYHDYDRYSLYRVNRSRL